MSDLEKAEFLSDLFLIDLYDFLPTAQTLIDMAHFHKIVKNYIRMDKLAKKHGLRN